MGGGDGQEPKVEFLKVPTIVVVRRTISKAGRQYLSFLPEQGCGYVRQYLEWRMRTLKEEITGDSPIITANPTNPRRRGQVREGQQHRGHRQVRNQGGRVRVEALRAEEVLRGRG